MRFFFLAATSMIIANVLFAQEKVLVSTQDYITYEDSAYANKDLNLDQRKDVMNEMIKGVDRFAGSYDIAWRTVRAIYVYSDMLHYSYELQNYETALKKNNIKDTGDVISESDDLNFEQESALLDLGAAARKYADKAVALRPEGVEGRYYDSMAIATYAFGKSIVKALLEGLGTKYQDNLDEALKINKDYEDGIIYIAYGRYWYKLPWPKRSIKKSLASLKVGEKYDPENMVTLDFLGDTCYFDGEKDEALNYWKRALQSLSKKSYQKEYVIKLINAKLKYLPQK